MKPTRIVLTALVVASSALVSAGTPLPDPIFKDGFNALCGNGVLEAGEDCDGPDLGGETCVDLGFLSGTLACSASCAFDTSGCSNCGNGLIDTGETCDGSNLGGQTCQSLGFLSGILSCSPDCGSFDTSGCVNEFMSCNWTGARWLSHGWDGGNHQATGGWTTTVRSRPASASPANPAVSPISSGSKPAPAPASATDDRLR